MNLICPHCQKLVTVPDQQAGQAAPCPACAQTFQVPALPQNPVTPPILPDVPGDIGLIPLPTPTQQAPVSPPMPPAHDEGVYRLAPEPPKPAPPPPPPRREERPPTPSPNLVKEAAPVPPPPKPAPAPPAGYQRTYSISISSQVVPWIAPVALVLVFLLMFASWNGAYPAGYGVYTQSGFRSIVGSFQVDTVGDEVLGRSKEIGETISANWLAMLLFLLLLLLSLVLSLLPHLQTRTTIRLPTALEQIHPWRSALICLFTALALLILLLELWHGFGLENAVNAVVEKTAAGSATGAKPEIQRGVELGRYNLQRTCWLWLALWCQVAAVVGAGLELWMEKRGLRAPPRVDLSW